MSYAVWFACMYGMVGSPRSATHVSFGSEMPPTNTGGGDGEREREKETKRNEKKERKRKRKRKEKRERKEKKKQLDPQESHRESLKGSKRYCSRGTHRCRVLPEIVGDCCRAVFVARIIDAAVEGVRVTPASPISPGVICWKVLDSRAVH